MRSTVGRPAAFGAEQVSPAGGFTTFLGQRPPNDAVPSAARRRGLYLLSVALRDGQELDREANRTKRPHFMLDIRRNHLHGLGIQHDIQRWRGRRKHTQPSVANDDPGPRPVHAPVRTKQSRWDRVLVPFWA